jgi:hypothetical protein
MKLLLHYETISFSMSSHCHVPGAIILPQVLPKTRALAEQEGKHGLPCSKRELQSKLVMAATDRNLRDRDWRKSPGATVDPSWYIASSLAKKNIAFLL